VPKELQIDADLRVAFDHREAILVGRGDRIEVRARLRAALQMGRHLFQSRSHLVGFHKLFSELGLTLEFRGRFFSVSLLGRDARPWTLSLLPYILRIH
jgi:hypothetical protein